MKTGKGDLEKKGGRGKDENGDIEGTNLHYALLPLDDCKLHVLQTY